MVTAGAWGVLTRCTLPALPCLVLLQVGLGALARLRACQSAQQPLAAAYSLWLCYSVPAPRPEFLLTLKSSSTYSWVGLVTSSVHVCLLLLFILALVCVASAWAARPLLVTVAFARTGSTVAGLPGHGAERATARCLCAVAGPLLTSWRAPSSLDAPTLTLPCVTTLQDVFR